MSCSFEADISPETGAARLRFNFANGWTASLVLREMQPNGCDALMASLSSWPTGRAGRGLSVLGQTEASADEAAAWLAQVAARGAVS